jgi:HTH-type transcriptional regulator/antitoxin MqsA
MKINDLTACPLCGGTLTRETRKVKTRYRDQDQYYDQPGQYCSSCGEAFLNSEDLAATAAIRKDFEKTVDRLLTAGQIKAVRTRLGLSQRRAGELFGGGPMAFSKYERGIASQSRSTDILLRLLASGKIRIKDIDEVEREGVN